MIATREARSDHSTFCSSSLVQPRTADDTEMASNLVASAPGTFVPPTSFAEYTTQLAEWLQATIVATKEFDAATTLRLRKTLVSIRDAVCVVMSTDITFQAAY